MKLTRITVNADQMGGIPCIRGLRIPVATVVGMIADGMSKAEILAAYPDLELEDISEALRFAAEAVSERELEASRRSALTPSLSWEREKQWHPQCRYVSPKTLERMTSLIFQIRAMVMATGGRTNSNISQIPPSSIEIIAAPLLWENGLSRTSNSMARSN